MVSTTCVSDDRVTGDVISNLKREGMGLIGAGPQILVLLFSHGPAGFERQTLMKANQDFSEVEKIPETQFEVSNREVCGGGMAKPV